MWESVYGEVQLNMIGGRVPGCLGLGGGSERDGGGPRVNTFEQIQVVLTCPLHGQTDMTENTTFAHSVEGSENRN